MPSWNKFIKSKFASWVFAIVLVLAGVLAGRVYLEKHQIDKEIAKLESKADEIKSQNDELSGLIKYWNTQEFQEKEAREKLNLKKDGEHVVVLPDDEEADAADLTASSTRSNPKKWFDYFFNGEK